MDLRVSIKKILRDFVLDVNFTVRDEVLGILGASGCGKSMTLKIIAGIETPDSGEIILNGRTLFNSDKKINLPPQMRRAGYLFQNYALFPNMTVAENILFAARDADLEKLLRRFRLTGLEKIYPNQLSGGQQQRVALARIVAARSEIIMLDEPLSALDSHLKWQLELELAEIFKMYGAGILVSHDRGEVYRMADKVAIMNAGKFEMLDTKSEVFSRPKTLAALILTGCENISPARKISADKIFATDWQLELTAENIPDDLKFIGIRAADLKARADFADNTFAFDAAQIIEDRKNFIVMIRAGGASLRMETEKILPYVELPKEKLIMI